MPRRRRSAGPVSRSARRLLARGSWPEARYVAEVLRAETVGGGLLLLGAVLALVAANSGWAEGYHALGRYVPWPGGADLHLDLSLAGWATDGLLTVFFFVVGLELKREFVTGDLRDPRRASVPVVAALGGMALPALVYLAVIRASGGGEYAGWAVPMATDIAFALAVLAVIGSHLPHGLRAFLLTLAVVDDLGAIAVIAIFYTDRLAPLPLLGALLTIALFGVLVRRPRSRCWASLPLAVLGWALWHASGIHATVAGVLLGFTVPVLVRPGERRPVAERLADRWRPVSAGLAVPVFAFFAAGVTLRGAAPGDLVREPLVIAIVAALVVGKTLGILGATYLLSRFTRAELDEGLRWPDLFGVALLGGIGFTVSLLIGELAFGTGTGRDGLVKAAVLAGSLTSALLASVVLTVRNARYRRLHEAETRDEDADGVPDAYQEPGRTGPAAGRSSAPETAPGPEHGRGDAG